MTTVLVVDDEPTLLDLVSEVLQDEGYAVVTARDGRAALAAFAAEPPALVLMDVMMPVMDGPTAYRAMRALPTDGAVPIVLTSAASNPARLDPGIDGFLAKPYDLVRLLALVARLAGPP